MVRNSYFRSHIFEKFTSFNTISATLSWRACQIPLISSGFHKIDRREGTDRIILAQFAKVVQTYTSTSRPKKNSASLFTSTIYLDDPRVFFASILPTVLSLIVFPLLQRGELPTSRGDFHERRAILSFQSRRSNFLTLPTIPIASSLRSSLRQPCSRRARDVERLRIPTMALVELSDDAADREGSRGGRRMKESRRKRNEETLVSLVSSITPGTDARGCWDVDRRERRG